MHSKGVGKPLVALRRCGSSAPIRLTAFAVHTQRQARVPIHRFGRKPPRQNRRGHRTHRSCPVRRNLRPAGEAQLGNQDPLVARSTATSPRVARDKTPSDKEYSSIGSRRRTRTARCQLTPRRLEAGRARAGKFRLDPAWVGSIQRVARGSRRRSTAPKRRSTRIRLGTRCDWKRRSCIQRRRRSRTSLLLVLCSGSVGVAAPWTGHPSF
jgi:hypothetical protein